MSARWRHFGLGGVRGGCRRGMRRRMRRGVGAAGRLRYRRRNFLLELGRRELIFRTQMPGRTAPPGAGAADPCCAANGPAGHNARDQTKCRCRRRADPSFTHPHLRSLPERTYNTAKTGSAPGTAPRPAAARYWRCDMQFVPAYRAEARKREARLRSSSYGGQPSRRLWAMACRAEARGSFARLRPLGFGAAAFTRFASEGWWSQAEIEPPTS